MSPEAKDSISRILSSAISTLLADSPTRTSYGVYLGVIVYFAFEAITHLLGVAWSVQWYQFALAGVGVMHAANFWRLATGKARLPETTEEMFEIVRRAKAEGLSDSHLQLQLAQICRKAMQDAERRAGGDAGDSAKARDGDNPVIP